MSRSRRARLVPLLLAVAVGSGCALGDAGPGAPPGAGVSGSPSPIESSAPEATIPPTDITTTPSASPTTLGPAARRRQRALALDRRAGVRSSRVAWSGGGNLQVVRGSSPAPGKGRSYRVRVEVESGLDVDRRAFATYVLTTLNDPRSWTENGRRRFARVDGPADFRVVLASPETSASICRPLRTFGKLSCRHGDAAVLTTYRWVKAIPEYADDRDGYRHYVINHEVGHALGHGHEYCSAPGRVAPVMMQQTKGLKGCRPNPWPFPSRAAE